MTKKVVKCVQIEINPEFKQLETANTMIANFKFYLFFIKKLREMLVYRDN